MDENLSEWIGAQAAPCRGVLALRAAARLLPWVPTVFSVDTGGLGLGTVRRNLFELGALMNEAQAAGGDVGDRDDLSERALAVLTSIEDLHTGEEPIAVHIDGDDARIKNGMVPDVLLREPLFSQPPTDLDERLASLAGAIGVAPEALQNFYQALLAGGRIAPNIFAALAPEIPQLPEGVVGGDHDPVAPTRVTEVAEEKRDVPRIKSADELEDWLKDQPVEFARVIAVRAALRVFPALSSVVGTKYVSLNQRLAAILVAFRSVAASWAASIIPNYKSKIASDKILAQAMLTTRRLASGAEAAALDDDPAAAARALRAVGAANSAIATFNDEFVTAIEAAETAAANRAPIYDLWLAISRDLSYLSRSNDTVPTTTQRLASQPLWTNPSGSGPHWFGHEILEFSAIFNHGENWHVWLGWYEPIASGQTPWDLSRTNAEALMIRIADQPDVFWNRESAEVNAEIAGWLEEFRAEERSDETANSLKGTIFNYVNEASEPVSVQQASSFVEALGRSLSFSTVENVLDELVAENRLVRVGVGLYASIANLEAPEQSTAATAMLVNDEGKVDVAEPSSDGELLQTEVQREDYEDIRDDAAKLREMGHNYLGKLFGELEALLEAMPEDMARARVRSIWRAGNRLRRTHNAHMAVVELDEPHEAKLDPAVAVELAALLDTFNNFAFGDPSIRQRDERRVPPQDRPSLEEEKAIADPLIEEVQSRDDIATDAAKAEIEAEDQNATEAGDGPHDLQAVEQANLQRRNFLAALISGAYRGAKGLVTASGKAAQSAISDVRKGAMMAVGAIATTAAFKSSQFSILIDYVVTNAVALKNYAFAAYPGSTVAQIIDWIVKLFP